MHFVGYKLSFAYCPKDMHSTTSSVTLIEDRLDNGNDLSVSDVGGKVELSYQTARESCVNQTPHTLDLVLSAFHRGNKSETRT